MVVMWIFSLMIVIGSEIIHVNSQLTNNRNSLFSALKQNITPMHKVVFTQRGYIQFLRWELPVPEINKFTFCVWVKSTNLTYPHSIFSYSKNEKDRLARAWIAANGQSIHLEINNIPIFVQPTSINVNRWYHICQSWDNDRGQYGLWIDGQYKLSGYAPVMAGHVIPKNGDITLGQEYTDFDKGLEEGIEGAVLGFNFLLASAFESDLGVFEQNQLVDESSVSRMDGIDKISRQFTKDIGPVFSPHTSLYSSSHLYAAQIPLIHDTVKSISNEDAYILSIPQVERVPMITSPISSNKRTIKIFNDSPPLGLRLIETGYYQCEIGRGSPFVGGKLLLISWTRTPVKIFGGAILKNVNSQCGVFAT